ncbi:ABC transporter [Heterobasidion irregulare TC 32-1]|uniref:ABC transporter n=1 Tax=Heterobasidion irregulare (strain TC 32-1) TaxID=747525 RepID=W4KLN8_HETIT|nr:ABC transporter [Heterobasidion irregulare TC 32-1]ETW86763.1 ABC transporter [Heterobasidion irregulare TC 32-1]
MSAEPTLRDLPLSSVGDKAIDVQDGFTTRDQVNVVEAEAEFNALSRQLSMQSAKTPTNVQNSDFEKGDIEKGSLANPEEPFDLREYLTSSNDANQAAGIKHKHVGVTWEGLSVEVNGGMGFKVSSGIMKPGEMCLVLGCPGSGCSTFLKAIANQRGEYASVSGDVRYAEIDATEMAKIYKGETPGPHGRIPGVSRKAFNEQVQSMLLKMLNISHTAQTLVGNEFVRGVSGGERKRVSIAEMMATRARVQCWDNSTRGLDASTALDYVKSLRVMTDVLGQTTFVTLYQAGEGIYNLFDKVMVLDEGRQVYFGPPSEARTYFQNLGYKSLPRQSTADYLTGCTDPNERQFATGHSAIDVPSNPTALEQAFLDSTLADNMLDSLEKYKLIMETEKADQEAFKQAVASDKKKGVSKKSPYTLGYIGQVLALARRQFQMRLQDRFQLITSFSLSTILAIVIGAAFLNRPPTSDGAFTRGSTSYSLYRPSAIALANTLADMPFSAVRLFLYDIIVYFMAHLYRSGGAFWIFHLFNYIAFLAIQGFFRTFGLFCSNYDSAFRLSSFFIPNLILYVGYMIPVNEMKRWLFWIYYLNPMSYAYGGLMGNEFGRLNFTCDGDYVVPRNGPGMNVYPDGLGPNQICTLFGSAPGSNTVPGRSYISAGYDLNIHDIWRRDFLVLVGWILFFQATQIIALDYFPKRTGGASFRLFAKENAETKQLNATLRERKSHRLELAETEKAQAMEDTEERDFTAYADRKTFTWERLNYHVPVPNGQLQLLNEVYGYVKPGTLTALMGASGAGKTTCLDVLAGRKNIGIVTGDVLVEGRPLTSDFARGTAYAEQMDVHEGTATIREAMRFSAYLRQPAEVSKEEKDAYVEDMIELLELHDIADAIVDGLDVEARKRLTIGVELASKPELLLFLDEPTSGLDAQSAWNLVRFLRKLASQGQAILCTIHQPSSLLFESFDRLLLLERGGHTVYFGDIGADSGVLREYLARHGAECPSNVNPAEYMLDAIGAGISPRLGDRDWKDVWLDSPECKRVREEINAIKRIGQVRTDIDKVKSSTYATPFLHQLMIVTKRNMYALWRSPDYVFTRLFVHIFISLFVSLPFLQLGHSQRDLQYRTFSIFWATILPAVLMNQIEPKFIENRRMSKSSSRIYSPEVFAIAQLLGEIPYSVLCAIVYWALMVYPQGFGQGAAGTAGTGFQLLVILFTELFGVSLGQVIAAITPSVQVAVLFNPFIMVVLSTFCGVVIQYPVLSHFWKSWLYELNPFTRLLSAMLSTELHGLMIRCKLDEFVVFNPPSSQTCQAWASSFVSAFGGYLDNPNDTTACRYCQYSVGDEFFLPLNIRFENRWRDAFIILAFFVFNFIVTIIASRFLRYAKR